MSNKSKATGDVMSLGNIYLLFYNLIQFLGWVLILAQIISHVIYHGLEIRGLYEETILSLKIFQTAAWLEVVHIIIGLVKSNAGAAAIQVFSRTFLVWGIVITFGAPKVSYGLLLMLVAWSVTEVVRYSFYFLNLLNQCPYFLVYLRYTMFIVLYPLGVAGEIITGISSMPEAKRTGVNSIMLPNFLNFTFSFYYFGVCGLISYIPLLPYMYMHMMAQRRKFMASAKKQQ